MLFGFWFVGYSLGYFAWLVKEPVIQLVESFGLSADMAGGLIMGLMGSAVMVLAVVVWSFFSSS